MATPRHGERCARKPAPPSTAPRSVAASLPLHAMHETPRQRGCTANGTIPPWCRRATSRERRNSPTPGGATGRMASARRRILSRGALAGRFITICAKDFRRHARRECAPADGLLSVGMLMFGSASEAVVTACVSRRTGSLQFQLAVPKFCSPLTRNGLPGATCKTKVLRVALQRQPRAVAEKSSRSSGEAPKLPTRAGGVSSLARR
jgi:hypothetical protein